MYKFKLIIICLVIATSCRKTIIIDSESQTNTNVVNSNDIVAPENFNWQFMQDYILLLSTDTLVDKVDFTLTTTDNFLVYEGIMDYGYAKINLKIPRDIKTLNLVSNNPKIIPGQTIDLTKPFGSFNKIIIIKNAIQADVRWIKKPNEVIFANRTNTLFKSGDILRLWDKNQYLYNRTLFEDLWPGRADYDFNDMVVDYLHYFSSKNANGILNKPIDIGNQIPIKIHGKYIVQANGAGYDNGLAISLYGQHINKNGVISAISNVGDYISGISFTNSTSRVNLDGKLEKLPNGEVVILLFNKIYNIRTNTYTNTEPLTKFGLGDSIDFTIELNGNVENDYWNGKLCNFTFSNPFLLQNGVRNVEIHVAGEMPTSLANRALFGTGEDNTNLGNGRTYVSKKFNFPWALTVPSNYIWPIEKVDLVKAYPNFNSWVIKNGTLLNEWRFNRVDSLLKIID